MSFQPAGYPMMALSSVSAVVVLALSVWRRSWSLWLLGIVLLALALGVAFAYRAVPAGAAA